MCHNVAWDTAVDPPILLLYSYMSLADNMTGRVCMWCVHYTVVLRRLSLFIYCPFLSDLDLHCLFDCYIGLFGDMSYMHCMSCIDTNED